MSLGNSPLAGSLIAVTFLQDRFWQFSFAVVVRKLATFNSSSGQFPFGSYLQDLENYSLVFLLSKIAQIKHLFEVLKD